MTTYKQDPTLPSHGRRAKADNAGTIRVRIKRETCLILYPTPEAFDFYLNICLAANTYNATVEYAEEYGSKKKIVPIEVPSKVIDDVIALSGNKTFMSLTSDVIFPDIVMMDGNYVRISVKTATGNLTLDGNILEDTLMHGSILLRESVIQTPFDSLAAIAFEVLGIDPYEE